MTDQPRVAPHNLEAEQAVLAACVLDQGALDAASVALTPDAFYLPRHRELYRGMLELSAVAKAVDMLTLSDHLISTGHPDVALAVSSLAGVISTTANVAHWIAIVNDKWRLRRFIETARELAIVAYDQPENVARFLDEAEGRIYSLNQGGGAAAVDGRAIAHAAFTQVQRVAESGADGISGLATGYADLDKLTCGLQPSELAILAGRPGTGKTALALNIARAVTANDKRVLVFSLEMSAEALGMRWLSTESRVPFQALRSGHIRRDAWTPLTNAANALAGAPLTVDDSAGLSIMEIRARARRAHSQSPLALIVIDYLQLAHGSGRRRDSREQEVTEISGGLLALAKELKVPVLALAQLNREAEKAEREPRLSDLRESGSLEQDAGLILFLHRVKKEDGTVEAKLAADAGIAVDCIIGKQRNGPTDSLRLLFFGDTVRFESYAGNYAADGLAGMN